MKPFTLPHKLDDDYELLEPLGGGLGSRVFLGKRGAETVAIKILNSPPNKNQQDRIQRFKKEFSLLKQLNHPHINKVFHFGYDDGLEKYYCVGEFIQGKDLKTACQHLSVPEIEGLFIQALQALYYLHTFDKAGLRHNDIKPSNMLVEQTADGKSVLKLIDFGLSRFTPLTMRGGTIPYMAPEQIAVTFPHAKQRSSTKPDQRADLYSLGVVWYLCLTGINPFLVEEDHFETLQRHFDHTPPLPSSFRSEIPAYLDKIILNLLKKNPEERFDGADEIIREINSLSGSSYPVVPQSARSHFLPEKWIGRKEAWHALKDCWKQIREESAGPFVVQITGKKGQGKTKILELFKDHVRTAGGKTKPSIILMDDLSDECSLLETVSKTPQMLVFTTPEEIHSKHITHRIVLNNFEEKDIREILKDIPKSLIHQLMKHTGGNPMAVFSSLKALLEKGCLLDEHGYWHPSMFDDIKMDLNRPLTSSNIIQGAPEKEPNQQKDPLFLQNLVAKKHVEEGHLKEAVVIYKETRLAAASLPLEQRLKITNNDLGYCYLRLQHCDEAIETLKEDLSHLLESSDKTRLTRCYYLLGEAARTLKKDFNKAIFYYRKCEETARDTKDIERLMRAYHGLAATYLDRAHSGDQTNAYVQATAYFEKCLAIAIRLKGIARQTDEDISGIRLTMAMVYQERGMLEKTKEHVESIITSLKNKKTKSQKTWLRLCQSYLLLADTHANDDKWADAASALIGAERILKRNGIPAELKFGARLLRARLCQKSGDIAEFKKHLSACDRLKKKHKIHPTPTAERYLDDLHQEVSLLQGQNPRRHNIATAGPNFDPILT
ncbi:MAG: protein kinase [Deltaproteobacteria bacterium]|nr:protein kinase [Deltaproteobacteria bacterium]